jgi:hypothetical protein
MKIFYKATAKEILDIRNKIVLETAIPLLKKNGFVRSPFSTAWNGRNNLKDFDYEFCRITGNSRLEIIGIYVARGEGWIKFFLNIFELDPKVEKVEQLEGVDGLQFDLPPNSITKMKLRSDDIKGPPLFSLRYMHGHKLKRFYTKSGLTRNIKRLTRTIEGDLSNIDYFVRRWHELHQPLKTTWTGQQIKT